MLTIDPLQKNKGFTLPEVLVSVSIFAVISVIAISAIISTADLARRTQKQRVVMDNLDFAMENISRRVRVGTKYICKTDFLTVPAVGAVPNDCPSSPGSALAFQVSTDEEIMFYYKQIDTANPDTDVNQGIFIRRRKTGVEGSELRLTSEEIKISNVDFYVSGATTFGEQPRVRVIANGYVLGKNNVRFPFDVQTTISQRKLDD